MYPVVETLRRGRQPSSFLGVAVVILLVVAIAPEVGVAAPPPSVVAGKEACADAVVGDWSDNGRIDSRYPLECYGAAIEELPPDVRDYSTATDEITRALANAVNAPTRARASASERAAVAAASHSGSGPGVPVALAILGGASAVLVAGAGVAGLARRLNRR
jgi:hypothetical protein